MAGEDNLKQTQEAYAAFSRGDAEAAMKDLADDIEWIVPGESAISGTYHGKAEVGGFWAKLAENGFTTEPKYWFSDEEHVVVLAETSAQGERSDVVDVLTFRDGKVVKFQSAVDTALQERIYGRK